MVKRFEQNDIIRRARNDAVPDSAGRVVGSGPLHGARPVDGRRPGGGRVLGHPEVVVGGHLAAQNTRGRFKKDKKKNEESAVMRSD